MYCNDKNYALFCFLKSVLTEAQRVNKLFESNNIDPTKLFEELIKLIEFLVNKTVSQHTTIDIFQQNLEDYVDRSYYLGYKFELTLQKLKKITI